MSMEQPPTDDALRSAEHHLVEGLTHAAAGSERHLSRDHIDQLLGLHGATDGTDNVEEA